MAWTDMTQLTNCYAWYKSESLSSAYANGDPITSWSDSSGNGRDITQATSASQPLAVASAVNGYMAADFDGSDDRLSSASYTQSGDVVVSIVVSLDVTKNYNGIISIESDSTPSWNNGGAVWIASLTRATGNFSTYMHDGSYLRMYKTPPQTLYAHTVNQYFIMTTALNSKTGLFNLNGESYPFGFDQVQSGGHFVTPPSGTAYLHLGDIGLDQLNGKIAEVVVFDAVNRACEEVAWVEGYLADKYAITLPNGHLFKNDPPDNAPTTYNASSGGGGGGGSIFHPLAQ